MVDGKRQMALFVLALVWGGGGCAHYGYESVCCDVERTAVDPAYSPGYRSRFQDIATQLRNHPRDWESVVVCGADLLNYAAETGNTSLAKLLLPKGAQINRSDDDGWTALMGAAGDAPKRTKLSMVRLLVEGGAEVNARTRGGDTALLLACDCDVEDVDTVYYLLSHGADFNVCDDKGETALEMAAYRGYYRTVVALIEAGADFQRKTTLEGTSLLSFAAVMGHARIVRYLIKRGADVQARDDFGATAFMRAAFCGDVDTLELLYPFAKNINDRSGQGETALIFAAKNGNLDAVRFLVEHGANVALCANDGKSALEEAICERHVDVVHYLESISKVAERGGVSGQTGKRQNENEGCTTR